MKDEGGNAKWSLERTLDEAILARHVTGQRGGPPMRCGPCDVSGGKRSKLPSALNGVHPCYGTRCADSGGKQKTRRGKGMGSIKARGV
jgi:hypothetical protein